MSTQSKSEREPQENSGAPAWEEFQSIPELRPYFLALAAQVRKWACDYSYPVSIGITGLMDRVGKSMVSLNLASSLAKTQGQRTLLVDANFDNPSLSKGAGSLTGFSDFLFGEVELMECVKRVEALHFDFMPHGSLGAGQQAALPFELLATIVDDQMLNFEYVLFDLPTVSQSPLFLSMSSQMNGIILVVDGKRREQASIAKLTSTLSRSGTQVFGMVVNKGV